jgi:hypothetical protein
MTIAGCIQSGHDFGIGLLVELNGSVDSITDLKPKGPGSKFWMKQFFFSLYIGTSIEWLKINQSKINNLHHKTSVLMFGIAFLLVWDKV